MSNAFNQISRQAILDQCLMFFPELLPWVSWCYCSHPFLWHPLRVVTSQSGVQQGDPLGPMLFALVLHKLVASDDGCFNLLLNLWYLDDGVLVGDRSAVSRALNIIEELGPHLGLHINFPKCELFSRNDNSLFPPDVKSSLSPNLDVLGVPIGDCSRFISERCAQSKALLSAITDVSVVYLHVSLSLLHICGSYSKLVHLARATPPSLCIDSLKSFDDEVRQCFASCLDLSIPDSNWDQAQLSLSFGGLGLRSLARHSPAAFISSLAASGCASPGNIHLQKAVASFNNQVSMLDSITVDAALAVPPYQHTLSKKLDNYLFQSLLSSASPVNKARLLSVSAPHAGSWISVVPSTGLGLHLNPAECQTAIKWWLGLDTSGGSLCPFCSGITLDPLGHHAISCRYGGFVISRHNNLRDTIANFCCRAHLSVQLVIGHGLFPNHSNSRPADILVQGWERGLPAAFDFTVASPLTPASLGEASASAGAAACIAETRKHSANDSKC